MNDDPHAPGPVGMVWIVLLLISCVHVFVESVRNKRVGCPIRHTLMCALVAWPLSYLLWLFWWPGTLRQIIFGSDRERAQRRLEKERGAASNREG